MQYLKNNLLVILLFLCAFNLKAQIFPSKHISMLDGLPNNQVMSILKDTRGILWVGTNNGLSKIENKQITNFFTNDGLAHNSSWDIIEDTNATIWIASYGGGITKFDGKRFTIYNESNGLATNFVRKLFEYKNFVFIGTENGLSFINKTNDSISTFDTSHILNIDSAKPDFQVMDFFVYNNELYCGTYKTGVFKVDIKNLAVKKVFDYGRKWFFSSYLKGTLFYYSKDGNGRENDGTLRKFNIDSLLQNKQDNFSFGKSVIWEYASDHENNLYGAAWGVNTNDGGIFQIKNDKFIDRSTDFGVESKNIRCIYFDTNFNNLYVGTIDKGFYIVNLNDDITYYKNEELDIIDIENSTSNIAFLHKKGLTLIKENNIVKHVSISSFRKFSINFFLKNPSIPKIIFEVYAKDLNEDDVHFNHIVYSNDSYWVSSFIGLFELNTSGEIINYYPIRSNQFDFTYNNQLINPIPYSSLDIVSKINEYSSTFNFRNDNKNIAVRYSPEDPNTPVEVSSFVKFNSKIYASTHYKGLFVYENNVFTSLNEQDIFKEMEISHLVLLKKTNTLVVGISSGEVHFIALNDGFHELKKINRNQIHGSTIAFLETYKEYVLIGTDQGLTIYNNGKIQFINEEQGLANHEFTSSKVIDDKLIIGTSSGYYEINLEAFLNKKPIDLSLSISNINVNHTLFRNDLNEWFNFKLKQIRLKHNENSIDLYFKVNRHPYPSKLLHSFQFEGLDTIWSSYSSNTNIFSHYLPPGKFNIVVKTKDLNSGKEYVNNLLTLIVAIPFWKTWWFITAFIVGLVLISLFIYNRRLRFFKEIDAKKNRIEKRIVEIKLEALQSQMNPHFTFNAMNSIQNYIIDNDIDNALMYLSEFAKLIRQTLDHSSKLKISLAQEISYLKSYIALENMRFNNKVSVQFNLDGLDTNYIMMPPMLIQPFVENVFIHAFDKDHKNPSLNLKFSLNKNLLSCEIADNGKGMSKNSSTQMHESKGLKLVIERLSLINNNDPNSFEIHSALNKGTIVYIHLKI